MNQELTKIKKFVSDYGISQKKIAQKMGMNESTFQNKWNDKLSQYNFNKGVVDGVYVDEMEKLKEVIKEIAEEAAQLNGNEVAA